MRVNKTYKENNVFFVNILNKVIMAKKRIQGLDGLLKKTTSPKNDKENTEQDKKKEQPISSSKAGTKKGETRATFIVNEETLDSIKALALWDRASIKEVIKEALEDYIEKQDSKKMKQAIDFYNTKKKSV